MEEIAAPPPDPIATLQDVAHAGQRPSPAQEEEAAAALKLKFSGNKAQIESGIASASQLPWNIAVKAASSAWPEMGVTARRTFLSELGKLETDGGKRLRLSLARGLHKVDPSAAIKIVSALCAAWKKASAETGLPGKERQSFFNVLVGKGKPWLLQWKWEDFKPADIPSVVFCALSTAFQGNCPPLTQSSLIRWTGASGKIDKLPEPLTAAIRKEIVRWKSKLREQTLAETPAAPDWLKELLSKPGNEPEQGRQLAEDPAAAKPSGEKTEETEAPTDEQSEAAATPAQERPARQENRHPKQQSQKNQPPQRPEKEQRPQQQQPSGGNRGERGERSERGERDRGDRDRGGDPLNLLRQVESHIQGLRNDLTHAKSQVRQREEEIRKLKSRGGRRKKGDAEEPHPLSDPQYDVTELSRHNVQLEERVRHLQTQLDELTENHEVVAVSKQEAGEDPENASREQFKVLVGLKLEELYSAFRELAAGPQNETLVDHYRDLIANIFGGLAEMGIKVPEAEAQSLPARSSRSMKSWKSE